MGSERSTGSPDVSQLEKERAGLAWDSVGPPAFLPSPPPTRGLSSAWCRSDLPQGLSPGVRPSAWSPLWPPRAGRCQVMDDLRDPPPWLAPPSSPSLQLGSWKLRMPESPRPRGGEQALGSGRNGFIHLAAG